MDVFYCRGNGGELLINVRWEQARAQRIKILTQIITAIIKHLQQKGRFGFLCHLDGGI